MRRLGPVLIAFVLAHRRWLRRWQRGGCDAAAANDDDARDWTGRARAGGALGSHRIAASRSTCSGTTGSPPGPGARPAGPLSRGCGPRRRIARSGESGCGCFPIGSRSSRSRLDPSYTEATAIARGRPARSAIPAEREARWPFGRAEREGPHRTATPRRHESVRRLEGRALGLSRVMLGAFAGGLAFTRARGERRRRHGKAEGIRPRDQAGLLLAADRPWSSEDRGVDRGRAQHARARSSQPASRPAPASSGSLRREERSTICPTATLIQALAADSALAQNPQPFGPGSFWYPVGPGRVCIYAPDSVLPCYTLVGPAALPGVQGSIRVRSPRRWQIGCRCCPAASRRRRGWRVSPAQIRGSGSSRHPGPKS